VNSDLNIGGIYPEVISTDNQFTSTIQNFNFNIYDLKFVKTIIDLKNTFIATLNA